jgi:hypothetical protein
MLRKALAILAASVLTVASVAMTTPQGSAAARIEISAPTTMVVGQVAQATATVYDAQGVVIPDAQVNWQQYNKGAVQVENSTGVLTATKVGTGYIVAKVGKITAQWNITVTQ